MQLKQQAPARRGGPGAKPVYGFDKIERDQSRTYLREDTGNSLRRVRWALNSYARRHPEKLFRTSTNVAQTELNVWRVQ